MGGFISAPPRKLAAGVYAPDHWDDGWRAAKRAAGTTPARVMLIGDSITSGQPGNNAADNTQDWLNESYYGYLRDRLALRINGGLGAEFFGLNESILRNPFYHDAFGAHAPLFYADGALTGPSGTIPGDFGWSVVRHGWWWIAASTTTTAWANNTSYMAAFTPPYDDVVQVDALYVNYFGNASANWKYGPNANSSGATTVSGIGISGNAVNRTTVYSGAASQPTVYFGGQGHSSDFYLLGCVAYRSTSGGLQIARHAFTGKTAGEFTSGEGFPSDTAKALMGGHNGTSYDAIGFPTCPHLAIFALGINDNNRSQTDASGVNADPHTYMHVLRRVVEAGRRGRPDMSILILLPYYPPVDYADGPGFAYGDSWVDYHQAAQVVAREYGCALLGVNARWGATAFAQGFTPVNDGHLLAAGYADVAEFIAGVV